MNVYKILKQLESTSSRNEKIAILENNKENSLLRDVLHCALNPYIQYYQRKIPDYPDREKKMNLFDSMSLLHALSSREVTGNKAIEHLRYLLSSVSEQDADVISRIVLKDLRCGVASSTVNKVWPNLIPEYDVMLCNKMDVDMIQKMRYPVIVQEKCDGLRINVIVKNGAVEYRTRQGKLLSVHNTLDDPFLQAANCLGLEYVLFDGEMLVLGEDGNILSRKEGNGILNKANKGTISKEEADRVVVFIWDVVPGIDVEKGVYRKPYNSRYGETMNAVACANSNRIRLVKTVDANSYDDVNVFFEQQISNGNEGAIVKDPNGIWQAKRVKHQIKMKAEEECDLVIKRCVEGTGKYVGMLGALQLETEDVMLSVSCGTGFSDEQRKSLWEQRDSLIGKVASIKYNMKITNEKGENSLFLPVFVEIRTDKTQADNLEDIK